MAGTAGTTCEHCGRPVAQPPGRGRRRRYCDATCRSAARRERQRRDAVANPALTASSRKDTIDTVTRAASADPDPGWRLTEVSDLAGRLAGEVAIAGTGFRLLAVSAAVDLDRLVERVLRSAVEQARRAGHTWQEIGDVLGTTRQAAFQRFGRPVDPRTGDAMAEVILPGAADRAVELIGDVIEGRYAQARQDFDDVVAHGLDEQRLAAAWAHVVGLVGGYERMGAAHAYQAGDYTVVDVALHFEAGDLTGRVSYDRAGKVAGLHFLPVGQPQRRDRS